MKTFVRGGAAASRGGASGGGRPAAAAAAAGGGGVVGRKRPLQQQQQQPAQSLSFGGPAAGAGGPGEDEGHQQQEEMDFDVPAVGADEEDEERVTVKQEAAGDQDFSFATPGGWWVLCNRFQRYLCPPLSTPDPHTPLPAGISPHLTLTHRCLSWLLPAILHPMCQHTVACPHFSPHVPSHTCLHMPSRRWPALSAVRRPLQAPSSSSSSRHQTGAWRLHRRRRSSSTSSRSQALQRRHSCGGS